MRPQAGQSSLIQGCGAWLVCAALFLGCHWQLRSDRDREWLERNYAPPPLQLPNPDLSGQPARKLRLRVYGDADYRRNEPLWRERFNEVVAFANRVTRAWYAVEFAVVEFRDWDRTGTREEIAELVAADPGEDVDWVVGLVTPLTEKNGQWVGLSPYFGRHFIMRSVLSGDQVAGLRQRLSVPPEEVYAAYGHWLARSNMGVFLHEWGHSLGAPHPDERGCFMKPAEGHSVRFCERTAAIIRTGLEHREHARGDPEVRERWLRQALAQVERTDLEPVSAEELKNVQSAIRLHLAAAERAARRARQAATGPTSMDGEELVGPPGPGDLDKGLIKAVIKRNLAQLRRCYEDRLLVAPELAGKVVVSFAFAESGAVTAANVASTTANDSVLEQCIVDAVRTWVFPPTQRRGEVRVTYPLVFDRARRR